MHLALVFPGRGYLHQHPVLRAMHLALGQLGATVQAISYDDVEDDGRFYAGVQRDVDSALATYAPDRLTLVGKSLGTWALSRLCETLPRRTSTKVVWLTPVWADDEVLAAAARCPWPSLHVVGLADPAHDPARQSSVPGQVLALPGANHAFEVHGDVVATIDAWRTVTLAVMDFVAE